jgi:hypothetical protein
MKGVSFRMGEWYRIGVGLIRCADLTPEAHCHLSLRDRRVKSVSPSLRLHGEFLLADDPKETKRSGAHEIAGLCPDTARLRPERLAMLKLASLRSTRTGMSRKPRSGLRCSTTFEGRG